MEPFFAFAEEDEKYSVFDSFPAVEEYWHCKACENDIDFRMQSDHIEECHKYGGFYYSCTKCSALLPDPTLWLEHMDVKHPAPPPKRPSPIDPIDPLAVDLLRTAYQGALSDAVSYNCAVKRFVCNECHFHTRYLATMLKHSLSVHGRTFCLACNDAPATEAELPGHVESAHKQPDGAYACPACPFLSFSQPAWATHLQQHFKDPMKFLRWRETEQQIKEAMRERHKDEQGAEKTFCLACNHALVDLEHRIRHVEQFHKQDGLFCCNKCTFSTAGFDSWTIHLTGHFEAKVERSLRQDNDDVSKCSLCDFTADKNSKVMLHEEKTHHLIPCYACHLFFTSTKKRREHVQKAHCQNDVYVCNVCDWTSESLSHWIRHHKRH